MTTSPTMPHVTQPGKRRRLRTWLVLLAGAVVVIGAGAGVAIARPWQHQAPVAKVASVRYLGVHEVTAPNTYTDISTFASHVGRQPNIVSYYSNWGVGFQTRFAQQAVRHGALPLVQIDPASISLQDIVNGRYDTYLQKFGTAVGAFRSKVVISFGHEMNGDWSSWGNGNTPSQVFVKAWQHVVDMVRRAGGSNATWMWTVNVVNSSPYTPIPDPKAWWPGARYVNWVGVDGYYTDPGTDFSTLFGPTLVDVRKLTSDPILIAETGADVSANQTAKVTDLFNGVRTYGLLGFIWFDENTDGHHWRITSPGALAAYQRDARAYFRPPASAP